MIQRQIKQDTREAKDKATIEAIGQIYCEAHHPSSPKDEAGMCADCREIINATLNKALSCPNGHQDNCQDCDIRCQRGQAQAGINEIMRYSAPRMAFKHPIMTLEYLKKKLHTK